MPRLSSSELERQRALSFHQTFSVYSGDAYATLVTTGIRCRLEARIGQANPYNDDRATLAASFDLYYDPAYVLPEHDDVQIEIDGARWNPISGSGFTAVGLSGTILYRRCTLIKGTPP